MIPEGSSDALLIEMNPRPTQATHLALGAGRDLVAGYLRGVLGIENMEEREAVSNGDLIALFPQELMRDANSEFIQRAYHDVPWESPELVARALKPLPVSITGDPRWQGVASQR